MAVGVRTRFEVFKRDDFTCRYCGKRSPEVVLEIDHIVPVAESGSDDPVNLATSCWACNSGKSCIPLGQVLTGEDPHDRAVLLLEQERQLREYNAVLAIVNARVEREFHELVESWPTSIGDKDRAWLRTMLLLRPAEIIRRAMSMAIAANKTSSLAYVNACLRNWKGRGVV
jgi:DnaD/phage-associated family protein